MNEFLERLKHDRITQIILGGLVLMVIIFLFMFRGIFSPKKGPEIPCYNTKIVIWSPFKEEDLYPFVGDFAKFCISFEIIEKSLEEIKKEIIYAIAQRNAPDIVYLDEDFVNRNKELFKKGISTHSDSLILFYNKSILNFFNLTPPRTFDELKAFIQKTRNYKENFYPIGLGTKDVKNRKEIVLSLMTLKENYQSKSSFRDNLISALDIFFSYSNLQSENFSYPSDAGSDLENFASEKTALYIGFYEDKKEILRINPRLDFGLSVYPLNTFPPKTKVYTRNFYFVIPKDKENKPNLDFLSWFSNYKIKEFTEKFDLVSPEDLPKLDSENFSFIDKDLLFSKFDQIFDLWQNNREEGLKMIEQIIYNI